MAKMVFLTAAVLLAAFAAAPQQLTFASPQEAAHALVDAAGNADIAALKKIFGPEGATIVDSGDPQQDRERWAELDRLAAEKAEIRRDDADRASILIGAAERPFPVPVVWVNGRWKFDSPAGRAVVNSERISANEATAIEFCLAYVDAQAAYRKVNGGGHYARHLKELATDEPFPKPFTRAVSAMFAQGSKAVPYRGYYFRILPPQAPENDRETADCPLVAYPARHGVSGIRTFLIDRQDILYGKDLGQDTSRMASRMRHHDADAGWEPVNPPASRTRR
jgi:hypothetical protein